MSTAYICSQIVTSKCPSRAITYTVRTGSTEELCVETAAGDGDAGMGLLKYVRTAHVIINLATVSNVFSFNPASQFVCLVSTD
jgi:hypothetical protein